MLASRERDLAGLFATFALDLRVVQIGHGAPVMRGLPEKRRTGVSQATLLADLMVAHLDAAVVASGDLVGV